MRQLRIYCAGVWHNLVMAVVAGLVLMALPGLLLPFYTLGGSVVVTEVVPVSKFILSAEIYLIFYEREKNF